MKSRQNREVQIFLYIRNSGPMEARKGLKHRMICFCTGVKAGELETYKDKIIQVHMLLIILHTTWIKNEVMSLSQGVSKNLTLCRIHEIFFKKYHVKLGPPNIKTTDTF